MNDRRDDEWVSTAHCRLPDLVWHWDMSQDFSQHGIQVVTTTGSELKLEMKYLCHWLGQYFKGE